MKMMTDGTKKEKSSTRREFLRSSMLVAAGLTLTPDDIIGRAFSKSLHSGSRSRSMNYPVRLGLNDSLISTRWTTSETKNRFFKILDQLGLTHVDLHLRPIVNSGNHNTALMAKLIQQIDLDMRQHSSTYTLNVEDPNFVEVAEITPGINEYDQPGGCIDGTSVWNG